jgi:hypothetical protein
MQQMMEMQPNESDDEEEDEEEEVAEPDNTKNGNTEVAKETKKDK